MKARFVAAIFALLISRLASAGGNEIGNGGGVWVCGFSLLTQSWTKSVDLFEAENVYDLKLGSFAGQSTKQIVATVKSRLLQVLKGPGVQALDAAELSQVFDRLGDLHASPPWVVDEASPLPTIHDAFYIEEPDCSGESLNYGQVIDFRDDGTIEIDRRLYNTLSPLTQAALITHEAIYYVRRTIFGDANSLISRAIVGLAFANLSPDDFRVQLSSLSSIELASGAGAGIYQVSVVASPTGTSPMPLSARAVSIAVDYAGLRSAFSTITDKHGDGTIDVPAMVGNSAFSQIDRVCLQLQGAKFCGHLAVPYENVPLKSDGDAAHTCAEITVRLPSPQRPGRIAINCFIQ